MQFVWDKALWIYELKQEEAGRSVIIKETKIPFQHDNFLFNTQAQHNIVGGPQSPEPSLVLVMFQSLFTISYFWIIKDYQTTI